MQGIEPDDCGAEIGGEFGEAFEVAEIADPPIGLRAQQVELERDAPERGVRNQAFRNVATRGNDDQPHFGRAEPVRVDSQSVIADFRRRLDHKSSALDFRASLPRARRRELGEGYLPFPARTVFVRDRPTHDLDPTRQRERDGKRRAGVPHHHYRRKRAIGFCLLYLPEHGPRPARVPDRKAHCGEEGAADLGLGLAKFARGVLELGLDTHARGKLVKHAHGRTTSCAFAASAIDHMTDHGPKAFRS